jgi:hypothetical protein
MRNGQEIIPKTNAEILLSRFRSAEMEVSFQDCRDFALISSLEPGVLTFVSFHRRGRFRCLPTDNLPLAFALQESARV